MKMPTVTKFGEDSHAEKKSRNDVGLSIGQLLCPLIVMYQIDEDTI